MRGNSRHHASCAVRFPVMGKRRQLVTHPSRWMTPPGVHPRWYLPHENPEQPEGVAWTGNDALGIGWCWNYEYGLAADHPLVQSGRRRPHPPGVVLWRDLDGDLDGWTVSVGFVLEDGKPRERTVVFYAEGIPTRVSRAQRELRITEAFAALRSLADALPRTFGEWRSLVEGPTGRRGTPEVRYAVWAQRRVEADAEAEKAGMPVLRWAAQQYGFSEGAIKQYWFKAREKGLLTPRSVHPPRLTDKAERLLAREHSLAEEVRNGER